MIWYIVIYVALAAAVFGGLIWTYRTREPSRRMGSVVRPRRPELISILVPFREDTTRRTRNWEWLEKFYRESILDGKIEIIEGEDDHFPFCKTAAVNDAFRKSKGDVIVVMDADCYIKPGRILEAATLIRAARKRRKFVWFVPYRRFYRLDEWASDRLLESNPAHPWFIPDPPPPDYFDHKNNISSGHWWGALITVLPREAFMAIGGMDERFCVDEKTEILTQRGWKKRAEISVGELTLTLNHSTGMSEWQPVQAINAYPGKHEMLSIESKTHSSLTTLNHRWPVVRRPDYRPGTGWGSRKPSRGWTTSETFTSESCVPIAAECAELPTEPKYSDGFVETVAWFWTEGSIGRLRGGRLGRNVSLSQSAVVNPAKCEQITAALTRAFGESSRLNRRGASLRADIPRWSSRVDGRNIVYSLNAEAGELVQYAAPDRVPSHEFLLSLTRSQLELFISSSLAGDGNERKNGYEVSLTQKNPAATEAFQFACILAGHATTTWTEKQIPGYDYGITGLRIRQQRQFKLAKGTHERVTHEGIVWCPTTPNGTWLARRKGKTYWTGNSGWGGEDIAMMLAVDTLYGKHKTSPNGVMHLWHPSSLSEENPFLRLWSGQDTPHANDHLEWRYHEAAGDRGKMLKVIEARSDPNWMDAEADEDESPKLTATASGAGLSGPEADEGKTLGTVADERKTND